MNPWRRGSMLLFGGAWLTLVAPSCGVDVPEADAPAACEHCFDGGAAGEAGSGETAIGAGRTNGGAGMTAFAGATSFSAGGVGGRAMGAGGSLGDAGAGDAPGQGDGGATSDGGRGGASGKGGSGGRGGKTAAGGNSGVGGKTSTGGKASAGRGPGTGGSAVAGGGGDAGSPECTPVFGFGDVTVEHYALGVGFIGGVLPNLGSSAIGEEISLSVYSNSEGLNGEAVGSFELGTGSDANGKTCARCLVVREDDSDKIYFATAGTLTFETESRQLEGYPSGTLRDVTLREATRDFLTQETTLVTGGDCLTLEDGDFLVNLPPAPPPPTGWSCEPEWYEDSECDCGCGVIDEDCASSNVEDCLYCQCNGDSGNCVGSAVPVTENHLCYAEPGPPPCTPLTGFVGFAVNDTEVPTVVSFYAFAKPNLGSETADPLELQLYDTESFPGGDQVGSFELGVGDEGNYKTCHRCLILQVDHSPKYYFATAGTLTFEPDSRQMEGYPHGTLRDVTLQEVTIDWEDGGQSDVVAYGSCLTVEDADLFVNVVAPPGPPMQWAYCPDGYYSDGSYCDCGCGAIDPDCFDSDATSCAYCYCEGDGGSCLDSTVNATQNYLCD